MKKVQVCIDELIGDITTVLKEEGLPYSYMTAPVDKIEEILRLEIRKRQLEDELREPGLGKFTYDYKEELRKINQRFKEIEKEVESHAVKTEDKYLVITNVKQTGDRKKIIEVGLTDIKDIMCDGEQYTPTYPYWLQFNPKVKEILVFQDGKVSPEIVDYFKNNPVAIYVPEPETIGSFEIKKKFWKNEYEACINGEKINFKAKDVKRGENLPAELVPYFKIAMK